MNATIIGIDAGKNGGIAWKRPGFKANVAPMPETPFEIVELIRTVTTSECPKIVFLEQLVKHMGVGTPASTMAVYASNWGTIQGAVIYSGARLEIVTPQLWQKTLGLGITGRQKVGQKNLYTEEEYSRAKKMVALQNEQLKRDWKNKLKSEAQRLFPELEQAGKITLKTSDSLLILEYGLKTYEQ